MPAKPSPGVTRMGEAKLGERIDEVAHRIVGLLDGAASLIRDHPDATSLDRAAVVMERARDELQAALEGDEDA